MLSFLKSFPPAGMSTWSHKEIRMQHKALCLSTQGLDINLAETYFPGPLPAGGCSTVTVTTDYGQVFCPARRMEAQILRVSKPTTAQPGGKPGRNAWQVCRRTPPAS
jgi:hypothetical protein